MRATGLVHLVDMWYRDMTRDQLDSVGSWITACVLINIG